MLDWSPKPVGREVKSLRMDNDGSVAVQATAREPLEADAATFWIFCLKMDPAMGTNLLSLYGIKIAWLIIVTFGIALSAMHLFHKLIREVLSTLLQVVLLSVVPPAERMRVN